MICLRAAVRSSSPANGKDEFPFFGALGDFAIVAFGKEAVEVVAGGDELGAAAHHVLEFLQLGVGGPNAGGLLDGLGSFLAVFGEEVGLRFFDGEVGGEGVTGDGSIRFGGGEVGGHGFERGDESLGAAVIAGLHGAVEKIEVGDVTLHLALFLAGKGGHGGEVFAEGKGFHEALGGVVDFAALEEKLKGAHCFFGIANGFGGEGIEGGDGGGSAQGFGEEFGDIGAFVDAEGAVAIAPNLIVKARGHQDVLEASLQEPLRHRDLVLGLGLNHRELGLDGVGLLEGFDLGETAEVLGVAE